VNSPRDEYFGFKIHNPVIDNEVLHGLVQKNNKMKKFLKAIKTAVELSNQWYEDGAPVSQEQLDKMTALFNTQKKSDNDGLRWREFEPGFLQGWARFVLNKRRKEGIEGVI
jgi:hypothetical protein